MENNKKYTTDKYYIYSGDNRLDFSYEVRLHEISVKKQNTYLVFNIIGLSNSSLDLKYLKDERIIKLNKKIINLIHFFESLEETNGLKKETYKIIEDALNKQKNYYEEIIQR